MKKSSAMDRLLEEGFFDSREAALPYLMSGAVYCGAQPVSNGGQLVPLDKPMTVRGLYDRYVGKGGYKLEGAIRDFGIAVEAGFGQLAGSLSQDARVVNLERTNLGDEKLLSLNPVPTLGSVDLSYLSLVKAVPQFRAVMHGQGELMCLVKPLFETDDPAARRTGELSPDRYAPLLRTLCTALDAQPDTHAVDVTHSPVTGNHGTHEFFLHVRFGGGSFPPVKDEAIAAAVSRALALPKYRK